MSEVLLCPLGSPAQAHENTNSMRKRHKSPNETRGFLHFSSLSAVDCLLLLNLGLWILSSAQGKVSECCSLPSLWAPCSPRERCSAGHTHLQLAPLNKLKQPAAFLRAALLSPPACAQPFYMQSVPRNGSSKLLWLSTSNH